MLRYILPALAFGLVHSAASENCAEFESTIAGLKAEIAANRLQCKPFSVVDSIANSYNVVAEVVTNAFERIALDDKVWAAVALAYEHSKTFSTDIINKASSVDYAMHMQNFDHYHVYVYPHVEKVKTAVKPYLDEHVNPLVEKVNIQMGPIANVAQEKMVVASSWMKSELVPFATVHTRIIMDKIYAIPIDKAVAPIFDNLEKIAPTQAASLPKKTFDRVLLIFIGLNVLYISLYWGRRLLHVAWFVARIVFKVCRFIFRLMILIPARTLFKSLRVCMYLGTCCFCCGLCRPKRSKQVADLKNKAGKGGDKTSNLATVADVELILQNAKREKANLTEVAKKLVQLVKSGNPLDKPKSLKGKTLTKEVLQNGLKNLPEINMKKLDW